MTQSTTLIAPDIACEHCQHAIEGAVGKEEVLDDTGYTVEK